MTTLTSAQFGSFFKAEELHGQRFQVYHNVNCPGLALPSPFRRCELCDVMIVTYDPVRPEVRLTFWQAKYDRRKGTWAAMRPDFHANMIQWSLLGNRPTVFPTAQFFPPPNLLSGAILPSVGSFGFFHRTQASEFCCFYATANCLQPVRLWPHKKDGYLRASRRDVTRLINGHLEREYATTIGHFGTALAEVTIGTPILLQSDSILGGYLKDCLQRQTRTDEHSSNLADELLDLLSLVREVRMPHRLPIPRMVLVRSRCQSASLPEE